MTDTTYGLLKTTELREIRDTVLNPKGSMPQDGDKRYYLVEEFYAVLNDDLAAATNPLVGVTVGVRRLKYSNITVNTNKVVDNVTVTVRNRSESLSGARGTLCLVRYLGAEYIFVWVDCEISQTLLAAL